MVLRNRTNTDSTYSPKITYLPRYRIKYLAEAILESADFLEETPKGLRSTLRKIV